MPTQTYVNRPIYNFLTRWFVCSLGLWIAAGFLSNHIFYENKLEVIIIAGLVLAIINIIIKPILIVLSLPAILLTLGLFMIVVNGLTVFIVSKLYTPLHVTNFWAASKFNFFSAITKLITACFGVLEFEQPNKNSVAKNKVDNCFIVSWQLCLYNVSCFNKTCS